MKITAQMLHEAFRSVDATAKLWDDLTDAARERYEGMAEHLNERLPMDVEELGSQLDDINDLVAASIENDNHKQWIEASRMANTLQEDLTGESTLMVEFSASRKAYVVF